METRNEEFLRVCKYVTVGGRGILRKVSLAKIIRDTDGIGRIYDAKIEPSKRWHSLHPNVKPLKDWWVVAFEPTLGEFDGVPAALCSFSKEQYPLPSNAYHVYRNTIE